MTRHWPYIRRKDGLTTKYVTCTSATLSSPSCITAVLSSCVVLSAYDLIDQNFLKTKVTSHNMLNPTAVDCRPAVERRFRVTSDRRVLERRASGRTHHDSQLEDKWHGWVGWIGPKARGDDTDSAPGEARSETGKRCGDKPRDEGGEGVHIFDNV